MTVYNAGAINGVELVQSINGVDIESIEEINKVYVEHMPLKTVIYYHGTIVGVASKTTEVAVMPGWYVCNGYETTDYVLDDPPDYINIPRFLRAMATIDDTGGGNDIRSSLSHSHSTQTTGAHYGHDVSSNPGDHSHTINDSIVRYAGGGTGHQTGGYMRTHTDPEGDTPFLFMQGGSAHDHTVNSSGNHNNHAIGNSGSVSPNNRPVYRTLIPLIRLRITNYTFAVGTILWFDGSFSNANGWYKCDGNNGTLNLLNKFIRGDPASNIGGGTDTAVNVEHNHADSSAGNHNHEFSWYDGHNHYYDDACWGAGTTTTTNAGGGSYAKAYVTTNNAGGHDHTGDAYTNSHSHACNSVGGEDSDNRPAFYSMQLVQRVS